MARLQYPLVAGRKTPLWAVASKWLQTTTTSQAWWELVGSQLAAVAQNASYAPEKQLEVLLFFFTQVASHLGPLRRPADTDGDIRWCSRLTDDGTPIEYSWKWNGDDSSIPEVRYAIEAIGPKTGTCSDPYNHAATRDLLGQLAPLLPASDMTWFYKFADALHINQFSTATEKLEAPRSTAYIAFEHVAKGIIPKVYFLPATDVELGGAPTFATFARAIRSVVGNTPSLDAVLEFVSKDSVGITLSPDMLAIDCVDPSTSRVKLYANGPEASLEFILSSLESIISIMSLGNRIQNIEKCVEELKLLLPLLLGQSSPSSDSAHPSGLSGRLTYNFDVAPGSELPDIKLYIPVLRLGWSDDDVAAGLAKYLELKGRARHVDGFLKTLGQLKALHVGNKHRIQTYFAVAFQKDGSLALTSYLNPGIYS